MNQQPTNKRTTYTQVHNVSLSKFYPYVKNKQVIFNDNNKDDCIFLQELNVKISNAGSEANSSLTVYYKD